MPWTIPIGVMSGRVSISKVISSNQQIFNLWDDCGQPTSPADIDLTINSGIFVDTFIVGDFAATTILNITHLGTIRGAGAAGGKGGSGEDLGDNPGFTCAAPLAVGNNGLNGGAAIFAETGTTINIDMDDGWIWGGGGGGGGGGSSSNTGGYGGGGGGGGRGWNVSAGGFQGLGSTAPKHGEAGVDGSDVVGGAGGAGAIAGSRAGGGGAGGTSWGDAGTNGTTGSGGTQNCGAGSGGAGGAAISGTAGTVTLTGAKSEVTLISEGRILGSIAT